MNSVLIANRGEIAVRIIRTCKKLGLKTVAIFSEADKDSYHTKIADYAVCIGPAKAEKSYLNIPSIMAVAKVYDVSAIHPGVGFLSENAHFQRACSENGIIFIGPDAASMDLLGDKSQARQLMIENDIPVPPGSNGAVESYEEALAIAEDIGYPVILKAAHGGGGGGIRIVHDPATFETDYHMVRQEALAAFGSDSVYLEKYLVNTRHIEVQVLADNFGNVLHFGTRECSMQRKNQKLVEEAPAPFISTQLRNEMENCAVKIARIAQYQNAGTVEFLLTEDNQFYFMEMNTRIQVEHPVTEAVYGVDLIKCQIQVAMDHQFVLNQDDIQPLGHAIECRVNAEDTMNNFRPSPGVIDELQFPSGYGVRVDSGYVQGDSVSPFYDSMVLKVICHGESRNESILASYHALNELHVKGIHINADFSKAILTHDDFVNGHTHTKWIENKLCKELFHSE